MVNFSIPNVNQPNTVPPAFNLSGGPSAVESIRPASAPQVERAPASAPQTGQTTGGNQSANQTSQNFGLSQTNGMDRVEISWQAVGTAQRTSPPSPESFSPNRSLDVNSELQSLPGAVPIPQGPPNVSNVPPLQTNPTQPGITTSNITNPEQSNANPPEYPDDFTDSIPQSASSPISDLLPGQFIDLSA